MLQIKSLFDKPEPQDGLRLWVGPIGLTKDLAQWCNVDRWLKEGSPTAVLGQWFEEHPQGWDYFRGMHHEELNRNGYVRELRSLSLRSSKENVTLLYGETNPEQNSAVSLYEYLVELQAYASDDTQD